MKILDKLGSKKLATRNRKYLNCGYTLVEIMTVVVIIGFLAAFAIPGYDKLVQKSRERTTIALLNGLHSANEIYRVKDGEYWNGAWANVSQPFPAGLEIEVNQLGMSYTYTRTAADAYNATAAWTGPTPFTIRVDEDPISDANNPCCSAGTCPSLVAC